MDEQKLTYEQFKEDILQWKNTHREEYNRFSRLMTNGDERHILPSAKPYSGNFPVSGGNGNCPGTMTARMALQI